jgi:hypothetical protein
MSTPIVRKLEGEAMAEDSVHAERNGRLVFFLSIVAFAPVFAVATGIKDSGVFRMTRLLPATPAF